MPAPEPPPDWRDQVLPALFWIGVALAPIAALLLLLGQGGNPARIAAVLTLVCVVLIGLSVALRHDVESVRSEIEATVLDEADAIREETREDIVAVARKMHHALREEIAELSGRVEEIRGQVSHDSQRQPQKEDPEPTRGVVRRTETVRVTTRHTTVSDEPTISRHPASASQAAPAARASGWSSRPPSSHPALESHPGDHQQHRTAPGRHWDPLSDDLADQPAPPAAMPDTGRRTDQFGSAGRRRAVEPDELVPIAELESGRRGSDPWADLRGGNTQPAEVRFAAREPATRRYSGGARGYGSRPYNSMERVPVRSEPTRPEPGPLDPGWRGHYR